MIICDQCRAMVRNGEYVTMSGRRLCHKCSALAMDDILRREPAILPKKQTFTSTPTTQRKLLSGLDCVPGQAELFETDGAPQLDSAGTNPISNHVF